MELKHSVLLMVVTLWSLTTAAAQKVQSLNGKLSLTVAGSEMTVHYEKQQVLTFQVGMETAALDTKMQFVRKIKEDYTMLSGKRQHCTNTANEYRMGALVVRLYNDGIAFRYELKGLQDTALPKELTAYRIPEGTKRWIQQWTDAYRVLTFDGYEFQVSSSFEYTTRPNDDYTGTIDEYTSDRAEISADAYEGLVASALSDIDAVFQYNWISDDQIVEVLSSHPCYAISYDSAVAELTGSGSGTGSK